jgi:hypothetical protein
MINLLTSTDNILSSKNSNLFYNLPYLVDRNPPIGSSNENDKSAYGGFGCTVSKCDRAGNTNSTKTN